MIVVTKKALIATVAQRWKETHSSRNRWLTASATFDPASIYAALQALPPNADEADVIAATGQPWWTENLCSECGADSEVTVGFGQELHHPTDTRYICLQCLQAGLALASQA